MSGEMMFQEEISSEVHADLAELGGYKTESNASNGNGKKWKLKNQRLSMSTIDNLDRQPTASTMYMSGRTRLGSETVGEHARRHSDRSDALHSINDIMGELPYDPFEASFYERPKLKNRRIPKVPTRDGIPTWMLDQGAMNVPDTDEASAIMDVLDEACNLFLAIPQLQALEVQHTDKESSAQWSHKRGGRRMPDMYHNSKVRLTAEVLAQFDASCQEEWQTVELPCCEAVTKNKLQNRSLMVPRY